MNRKIIYDIWESNCLIVVTVSKWTLLTLWKWPKEISNTKKKKFHFERERNNKWGWKRHFWCHRRCGTPKTCNLSCSVSHIVIMKHARFEGRGVGKVSLWEKTILWLWPLHAPPCFMSFDKEHTDPISLFSVTHAKLLSLFMCSHVCFFPNPLFSALSKFIKIQYNPH